MKNAKIFIGTPVRNSEPTIQQFLISIKNLDYPLKLVGLYFLVNNSQDKSKDILLSFKEQYLNIFRFIEIDEYNFDNPSVDTREFYSREPIYENLAILRNKIIDRFLQDTAGYHLAIDSDTLVAPNCLNILLNSKKNFITVPLKVCLEIENSRQLSNFLTTKMIEDEKKDIFKIEIWGGDCGLIDRKMIKAGVRWGFHSQGEGVGFSLQSKEKGFELFCCKDLNLAQHKMFKK
ncbi:glycosyltransferase family 2 protein [Patescibacteria group bacterium]|nr:glycosyltransferase family 2 protein [Patescibacteria group bacterium]